MPSALLIAEIAAMITATVSSSMPSSTTGATAFIGSGLATAFAASAAFFASSAFLAALLLITSNILPYIDTSRISRTSPINTTTIPVITTEATVPAPKSFWSGLIVLFAATI